MSRRHRIVAALLAALALVFAQLAVSAHACALASPPPAAEATADHACCNEDVDGQDSGLDNVCVEHCQYGGASFDGGHAAPGIVDALGPVLRLEHVDTARSADRGPSWLLAASAAPPPAALLFGVLRI